MSRTLRLIGSISCVAMLLAFGVGPRAATNIARADDCLAQPDSSAPEGSHWYYHTDRATQRKCWYLRASDQQAQQPVAHTTSPVTSATLSPLEKPESATSQANPMTPTPLEKPRAATSRVRPTAPIPLEKPAIATGGAPVSITPSTPESQLPHIKMLTVVSSGATNTVGPQAAKQQNNTTAITAALAPEESASRTSDQVAERARAAAMAWPDAPTSPMATHDPIPTPVAPPTESIQATSDARAADAAAATAHGDASTDSLGALNLSIMSEPVEMPLVAALGLVIAGFLFRIAMKIAGAHRRRIIVDRSESHWLDDPNGHESCDERQHAESVHPREELIDEFIDRPESDWIKRRNQHELRDKQQYAPSVQQREELIDEFADRPASDLMDDRNEHELRDGESGLVHQRAKLIDDLQRSVTLTPDDDTADRLFRNDYELQEKPQRRDREPNIADQIGKREDRLEQLKRDLDRLLRTPKVA
jgi:hypothetical protein